MKLSPRLDSAIVVDSIGDVGADADSRLSKLPDFSIEGTSRLQTEL